jgi:soluble lytic murein transglycosylase-like protein
VLSTPTPAPIPTPDPVEVTSQIVANICQKYRPVVEIWEEDFPDIDPDVVLAMMAQESHCDKKATDGVSIGLMQIIPRYWTLKEKYLWDPKWNIWQGMQMLNSNLHNEKENPTGSLRRALAAYNCGWTSLNKGECLSFGGYAYADRVLEHWLPYFSETISEISQ